MKTKQVTKPFTRSGAIINGGWENAETGAAICGPMLRELWNIPAQVKRIWVTAQTFPEPGKTLRLRKDRNNCWELPKYGLFPTAMAALDRYFPKAKQVYIAVEYLG